MPNELIIRRNDFSISKEERSFVESVRTYLRRECDLERVRAAEPLGFDADMWASMTDMGVVDAGLDVASGGAGSLLQATLVAEEVGSFTAPVPYIESVVAARLLSRAGEASATELGEGVSSGHRIVGLAPGSRFGGWPQMVSVGAVADAVIGLDGGQIVLLEKSGDAGHLHVRVQGHLPTARWEPGTTRVTNLVEGDSALFDRACDEYRVLTAAALCGMASAALQQAAEFASTRTTKGVPIGSLQGVSHPLAECKVNVEGARQTARKAAWFIDAEPDGDPKLPSVAFIAAARAADEATRLAMHVNGGMGVMMDSESARYFVRSKSWAAVVGRVSDVQRELAQILRTSLYLDVAYPSML